MAAFTTEEMVEKLGYSLATPCFYGDLELNLKHFHLYVSFYLDKGMQMKDFQRCMIDPTNHMEWGSIEIPVTEGDFLEYEIGTMKKDHLILRFPEPNTDDDGNYAYGTIPVEVKVTDANKLVRVGDIINAILAFSQSIPERPDLDQENYPYDMYTCSLGFINRTLTTDSEIYDMEMCL